MIKMNKYQTPLTKEVMDALPEEVQEQLIECLTTIPMIKRMVAPDRPYARDLPRDEKGRIIVDISNPHIIEDADYFRQAALHYLKHGTYTFLRPNTNPNSAYRKHWDEEKRRCWEGYVRESDGEWVTGFLYWFLNYCPMMINEITPGKKKAIRKEAFAYFFEGVYWRYHYLSQARESGKHAIELAKRGAHPYDEKVYTPEGVKKWGDINIGDKLYGTYGNITTVTDIPFNDIADTYKITLRDGRVVYASDDHIWNVMRSNTGKILNLNTKYLYEHYINYRKVSDRIPSGKAYVYFIPKNGGVDFSAVDTPIDSYTLGVVLGGTHKLEDKFIPDLYKYNSREVRLNMLKGLLDTDGGIHGNTPVFNTASRRLAEDVIEVARSLGYNSNYTTRKAGYKINGEFKQCLDTHEVSIYGGKELFNLKRKQDKIVEDKITSRATKTCITNIEYVGKKLCKCVTVDSEDSSYLIGDFIQTHNCAKSYSLASIMSHNLILGESEESKRRVVTVLTAYQKEYLSDSKDGTLAKFKPGINFSFANTPFPRLLLKNSPNEMAWQMGYKDEYGVEQGSLNQVLAVSSKDDSEKLRGKRGWILFEEMGSFKGLLSLYDITRKSVEDGDYTFATMYLVGCVCAGTKVWTMNGRNINIEDLNQSDGIVGFTDSFYTDTIPNISLKRGITKEPIVNQINIAKKECVKITLSNGNNLRCSIDHPILIQKLKMSHDGSIRYYDEVFKEAKNLSIGDRVIESREVPIFGTDTLFNARLVGMLIGDGSYGVKQSPKYSSEDKELLEYIKNEYPWSLSSTHITKNGKIYEDIRVKGICPKLRDIGIYGQVKSHKRLPINYQTLTKEDSSLLLSGLYDTDGSIWFNKDGYISLTQSNREILEQVQLLWRKFGVIGTIIEIKPRIQPNRKDKNSWYTLTISGRCNCIRAHSVLSLLVPHKKDNLNKIKLYYNNNPSKKPQKYPQDILVYKVTSVENIGEQDVYNLTAGLSHTYLANNIVTHNTAAESESDFSSAKTLLYSPEGYNIHYLDNVFDKPNQGKEHFGFFYGAYVNRAGCYNKDGVSDVTKALIEVLIARHKSKYSADPKSVIRVIAEDPITPAEAIIKVKEAYFPVVDLTERLSQLDQDPNAYNEVLVGNLSQVGDTVEFSPSNDTPIRKFGVDNNNKGALEIFELPIKDRSGKVPNTRYLIGHDPVDNDQADSSSLSSTFVLDLWTDRIVAEYTGRNSFADDNFEMVRKLCLFYNAKCLYESNKKGIFAYFQKMNSSHLLADTPEYLRDKVLIKYSSFGSNSKGVNASAAINMYANNLIRDWLLKPMTLVKVEDGQEIEYTVHSLFSLKNRALIEELIAFTPEINVDRIRALGMLMLYREEKMILYGGKPSSSNEEVPSDYLGNDPFFSKNYKEVDSNSKFSKSYHY